MKARRMPIPRLAAVLMICGLSTGCVYLRDRGNDFADIFILGVSSGSGVAVSASPTRFVNLEVGGRKDEVFYGLHARHFRWAESSYGIPCSSFWSPRIGEERFAKWTWTDIVKTSQQKTAILEDTSPESLRHMRYSERGYHLFVLTKRDSARFIDDLDIAFDMSFLIGGVCLGVNPGQLVDFLAGLVGLDPVGDDGGRAEAAGASRADGADGAEASTKGEDTDG